MPSALTVVVLASFSVPGRAGRPRPAVHGPVVVLLEPSPGALATLSQSLASFLKPAGVSLRTGRLDRTPGSTAEKFRAADRVTGAGVVAVCWCERTGRTDFLNLVDVRSRRLVVRAVGRCTAPEGAETAALIVRAALEGILAETRPGTSRSRRPPKPRPHLGARPAAPRPVPPRRAPEAVHGPGVPRVRREGSPFLVGLFYRGEFASHETLYASGGGLSLGARLAGRWRLEFAFWVRQPLEGSSGEVSLVAYSYGLSLGGGYGIERGRWRLGGTASLVAVIHNLEVRESPGIVAAQEKNWDVELCVEAGAVVSMRLGRAAWLELGVGLQVPVLGVADYYVVGIEGEGRRLLRLLPVRPLLRAGVLFGGI